MTEPLKPCQKEVDGAIWTVHTWAHTPISLRNPGTRCDCGVLTWKKSGEVACEHGRQRRKCEVCALIEAEKSESALLDLLVRARAAIGCACAGTADTCADCLDTLDAIESNPLVKARLEEK